MENRKLLYLTPPNSVPLQLTEFRNVGWDVRLTEDIAIARNMVNSRDFHVGLVFLDSKKSNFPAEEELLCANRDMKWIAMLSPECVQRKEISRIIRDHFYDFHTLPTDTRCLLPVLGHAYGMACLNAQTQPEDGACPGEDEMVGTSGSMQSLFASLRKVAGVDAPVLISGESGTGKELSARAIHERSDRATRPFVAVNCGALPATLIQSELFGYEKGAFTGASQQKIGRIESASGGTIFLDEIGDLPLDMQVNLLRFLQEKTIERVGATDPVHVDARVIAATHVNLEEAVSKGKFREDLYYRLHVLDIRMPPLRERHEDIELLARFFFKKFTVEKNKNVRGFTAEALNAMNMHDWPGNVREMINRIRRAMVMSEHPMITAADLDLEKGTHTQSLVTLEQIRIAAERQAIKHAMRCTNNNLSRASHQLGISRMTLYRLIEKCGVNTAQGMK